MLLARRALRPLESLRRSKAWSPVPGPIEAARRSMDEPEAVKKVEVMLVRVDSSIVSIRRGPMPAHKPKGQLPPRAQRELRRTFGPFSPRDTSQADADLPDPTRLGEGEREKPSEHRWRRLIREEGLVGGSAARRER